MSNYYLQMLSALAVAFSLLHYPAASMAQEVYDTVGRCYFAIVSGKPTFTRTGTAVVRQVMRLGINSQDCVCPAGNEYRTIIALSPEVRCLKTGTLGLVTSAPEAEPFLVPTSRGRIRNKQHVEYDLGGALQGEQAALRLISFKNQTAQTLTAITVNVGEGIGIDRKTLKTTLAPGEGTEFTIALVTTSVGIVSSRVTISAKGPPDVQFSFPVGGMVWGFNIDQVDTSREPPGVPKTRWAQFGAEEGALLNAKTVAQYEALRPDLTIEPYEARLLAALSPVDQAETTLAKLAIALRRSALSPGAHAAAVQYVAYYQGKPSDQLFMTVTRTLSHLQDDANARARALLLDALAAVPALAKPLRVLTETMLKGAVADYSPGLNAFGRFWLRVHLMRTYLGTRPSLAEANEILNAVLAASDDRIARGPILAAFSSQYPEVLGLGR